MHALEPSHKASTSAFRRTSAATQRAWLVVQHTLPAARPPRSATELPPACWRRQGNGRHGPIGVSRQLWARNCLTIEAWRPAKRRQRAPQPQCRQEPATRKTQGFAMEKPQAMPRWRGHNRTDGRSSQIRRPIRVAHSPGRNRNGMWPMRWPGTKRAWSAPSSAARGSMDKSILAHSKREQFLTRLVCRRLLALGHFIEQRTIVAQHCS